MQRLELKHDKTWALKELIPIHHGDSSDKYTDIENLMENYILNMGSYSNEEWLIDSDVSHHEGGKRNNSFNHKENTEK